MDLGSTVVVAVIMGKVFVSRSRFELASESEFKSKSKFKSKLES
ncbi:hypothetical protein PR002_g4447 [Phytophthora rubi]|uniref:Uncharacterized protein n=1 Tax=Phytophthora rubi TaxID=129364 RepID=A0A6A3NH21_9STRA|nr:hypothetical protein PR002_g4447 [Phytophthora rubi]